MVAFFDDDNVASRKPHSPWGAPGGDTPAWKTLSDSEPGILKTLGGALKQFERLIYEGSSLCRVSFSVRFGLISQLAANHVWVPASVISVSAAAQCQKRQHSLMLFHFPQ